MHISTEAATSSIAITIGMRFSDHFATYHKWASKQGMGAVEMYEWVANYGTLSTRIAEHVIASPEFKDDSFPGVYAYEVDEALGAYIDQTMTTTGDLDETMIKLELGRLTVAYFKQVGKPIPDTRRIIEDLTGYSEPGYVPEPVGALEK